MSPVAGFRQLQRSFQQQYGRGGKAPKFLVSKSVGLQGVAFLDWYEGQRKQQMQMQMQLPVAEEEKVAAAAGTGATTDCMPRRRSRRSEPQSALAAAVAESAGDVQHA